MHARGAARAGDRGSVFCGFLGSASAATAEELQRGETAAFMFFAPPLAVLGAALRIEPPFRLRPREQRFDQYGPLRFSPEQRAGRGAVRAARTRFRPMRAPAPIRRSRGAGVRGAGGREKLLRSLRVRRARGQSAARVPHLPGERGCGVRRARGLRRRLAGRGSAATGAARIHGWNCAGGGPP